jgi:beta-glucosidase
MPSRRDRIEKLLAQMTLEEKLAQLGSCWMYELQTKGQVDPAKIATRLKDGIGQVTRVGGATTFPPPEIARVGNLIQKYLVEQTRLGIPAILHEECCCGAMVQGGTVFPQMLGLAATFQPELAETMTKEIRKQLLAIGARQALAPVLDLAYDPRWGRVEETFGEDPVLVSAFGTAYVKGLQGNDLSTGVAATGKHFIGHSLSQGGLNCGPVHLGSQELLDVYLTPFQAAIREAGLAAVMNAYPEIDGEVVAASRRILTDLLRGRLDFQGLVVSDYQSVAMLHNFHSAAADFAQAAAMAIQAGIDVELPTVECYGDPLRGALEAGEVSLEVVDRAVLRHLALKQDLGLFDHPYVREEGVAEVFETPANRDLARRIARQSMVLLKNDGILPLSKSGMTLAVIGPNAASGRHLLGDYAYIACVELLAMQSPENSAFVGLDVDALAEAGVHVVPILEGLKRLAGSGTTILQAAGCELRGDDRSGFAAALEIAGKADAVILVLGDRSGLTPECTTGETRDSADLRLPPIQEELAQAVLGVGKPVILVLVNGRPLALPGLADRANAVLEAWLPGEEGGVAVAEVLFGDANPGGKLPITFPRSVGQVPLTYHHKPSGMRSHWYGDYVAEAVEPRYPFGHGLSYTTFAYEGLKLSPARAAGGDTVQISFDITNTGSRPGEEVAQLYVRDVYASSPRPVKQLRSYLRVSLQPGERKRILFRLPVDMLAYYDRDMRLLLDPGRFEVQIGSSSADIRLRGELEVVGQEPTVVSERVFHCPVEVLAQERARPMG